MEKVHMRPAVAEDVRALAQLKHAYVQSLYKGFLPMEMLRSLSAESYVEQLADWLDGQTYSIDLWEENDTPHAFIVFGEDAENPGCGLIYEGCCELTASLETRRELLYHVLDKLHERGCTQVHMWIMRDNFRVRFIFESMGFRPDGERRTVTEYGQELLLTHYVYQW